MKTTILPTRNWLEPYPRTFIITKTMMAEIRIELRELTVGVFLVAVARNASWRVLYRIRELVWRIGFLDFDEARCGEEGYHGDLEVEVVGAENLCQADGRT